MHLYSVGTVDYDYSKAYGVTDSSVVSSVGGTMGEATRETMGDAAGLLGTNRVGGAVTTEEILDVEAPAGKLGVVIDTPNDGAPVVHAVKDSSVISDKVQVGDLLIAVDDQDVRSMSAIQVSKLISKKSGQAVRKLTLVRTVYSNQALNDLEQVP